MKTGLVSAVGLGTTKGPKLLARLNIYLLIFTKVQLFLGDIMIEEYLQYNCKSGRQLVAVAYGSCGLLRVVIAK